MRITISGRNIELTEGLKQAVEEKLSKLEKFFKPDTDVYVTLSVEKDRQKIEVTIPAKGHVIRSEQVSNDMYVSIDLVEEVIERQLRKYRTKISAKKYAPAIFQDDFVEADDAEDEEIKIVRTKRFGMKPMYPEDACIQMELSGHDFFVFRNAENDEVNVVYKRKGIHTDLSNRNVRLLFFHHNLTFLSSKIGSRWLPVFYACSAQSLFNLIWSWICDWFQWQ